MSAETLTDITTLVVYTCPTCGVRHAFPKSIEQRSLAHRGPAGWKISCPNGHAWWFTGQTESERERALRESAERQLQHANQQRQQLEHALRAQKAAKTRLRNRIRHGVCPCCTRTFVNLQRHMATQHPDYGGEA